MEKQEIINIYNQYKELNGKKPLRSELCKGNNLRREINKIFGSYSELQRICGDRPEVFISEKRQCQSCQNEFQTNFTGHIYCSKGCSNKITKLKHGRYTGDYEPEVKQCAECNKDFIRARSLFCSTKCSMTKEMKGKKIKDIIKRTSQNKYDVIRQRSRNFSKYFYEPKCYHCGYDKHYEVCHIKDI